MATGEEDTVAVAGGTTGTGVTTGVTTTAAPAAAAAVAAARGTNPSAHVSPCSCH